MSARDERVPPAALAELQAAMVRAALRGTALPGGVAAQPLPDRGLLPTDEPAPLAAEHLAPGTARLLEGIVRVTPGTPRGAHLRFRAPAVEGDTVWLTLELMGVEGAGARALPLGGLQAGFRESDGRWEASEAPRAYAS